MRKVLALLTLTLIVPLPAAAAATPLEAVGGAADRVLSGGLEDAVLALAELGDTPVDGASPGAGIPSLVAATDRAGELARGAIRDPAGVRRLHTRTQRLLRDLRLEDTDRLARAFERAEADLDRLVDRDAVRSAALLLARALDGHGLEAVPPSHVPAAGCDLVDQAPALCVAGPSDNTHVDDYAVLVELGGDDLYTSQAGGADPTRGTTDPTSGDLAASVVVDLAGNDTYRSRGFAQGAGNFGGVGALVDAQGNDTYEVRDAGGFAAGHGYGTAGVGLHADLGGADTYLVENGAEAIFGAREAGGKGTGWLGGVGVSLDLGGANDVHRLVGRPIPFERPDGTLIPGDGRTVGVGYGVLGGQGLFVDDGGTDLIEMAGTPVPIEPGDPRELAGTGFGGVYGPGVGAQASVGLAITGPGDTVWRGVADAQAPHLLGALVDGFGMGFGPGLGALHDAGGDDTYDIRVSARALQERRCACEGPVAETSVFTGETLALGFGWTGGTGLMHDVLGDDTYTIAQERRQVAIAVDERAPEDAGSEDVGPTAVAEHIAQANAVGMGASLVGTGIMQDDAGDDVYEIALDVTARAEAEAPVGVPETARVEGDWDFRVWGQGAGATGGSGHFSDLGGVDAYRATSTSSAEIVPGGEVDVGRSFTSVQGGSVLTGVGVFRDADGGAADVFEVMPPYRACAGTHGGAFWQSCDDGLGIGSNT